ncbi:hypothetical protein V1478_013909, partial [Vespula squamosa]
EREEIEEGEADTEEVDGEDRERAKRREKGREGIWILRESRRSVGRQCGTMAQEEEEEEESEEEAEAEAEAEDDDGDDDDDDDDDDCNHEKNSEKKGRKKRNV